MDSIVRRPTTPCGVPGLCTGEALCLHDNFFCVWLFTIYTVLCCAHLCWSDIKVLCPLAVYVVSGSIVASVGVNPSQVVAARRDSRQSEAERTLTLNRMTTRSGRAYTSGTIERQADTDMEQGLAGLTDLLRAMLEERKQKEEEEARRTEQER